MRRDARIEGCVRRPAGGKGDGVFATRPFEVGETVLVGAAVRQVERNDAHAVQMGRERFGYEDGIGSIVNHSCDPNCGVQATELGVFDLVARRPIELSEEVTVDYAMRNFVVEYFPPSCLCGSALCRGPVIGWKDLPLERRLAYEGFVAPYLLEMEPELRRAA